LNACLTPVITEERNYPTFIIREGMIIRKKIVVKDGRFSELGERIPRQYHKVECRETKKKKKSQNRHNVGITSLRP